MWRIKPFTIIVIFCCPTFCFSNQQTYLSSSGITLIAPSFVGTKISIIRSNTSELPESINREAYATIDRAREAIVNLQNENGSWGTNMGEETILPALALFDGTDISPYYSNQVNRATIAAQKWLIQNANKPWSSQQTKEAVIALYFLALTQQSEMAPAVAIDHLKSIPTQSIQELDPIGKYFFILALEQYGGLSYETFDAIIREQASVKSNNLLHISIIGISRLMRANLETPANDAKAYLRFLSKQIQLGYHNPSPGENENLNPQLGFLTMIFASSFSHRQLALDPTLFPYDWRNHLANRIIASQIYCESSGHPYWKENIQDKGISKAQNSYSSLEATTLAIITLTNLAN